MPVTRAGLFLREYLQAQLASQHDGPTYLLNIGAGRRAGLEDRIAEVSTSVVIDRLDVQDCQVEHPLVRHCWLNSMEHMHDVASNAYDIAFANYVLEHVPDLNRSAQEVFRVLKPTGIFVVSTVNVQAPEFIISRHTPMWFHHLVAGDDRYETQYSYSSIFDLIDKFERAGFHTLEINRYPCVGLYMEKFPILSSLGKLYDNLVVQLNAEKLLGDIAIVFQKD